MRPYYSGSHVTLYCGDALTVLRGIPEAFVQTCITSPPYWGLRDYGTASWDGGDPACAHRVGGQVEDTKASGAIVAGVRPGVDASTCIDCGATRVDQQIGLERTPDEYVAKMVEVFREVRRVLRDDGTLWLNLGDSYASSPPGNSTKGVSGASTLHGVNGASGKYRETLDAGHATKRNTVVGGLKPKDLVGIPWRVAFALQADGWRLRSDIIWSKPNPMPESVRDRPTKAHEYVFLLTKSATYYYDADAVAEPDKGTDHPRSVLHKPEPSGGLLPRHSGIRTSDGRNGQGRNKRTVWTITTKPYPDAHFATFPPELPETCIKAGSKPGDTVLDPFAGAGTTLYVAKELNRKAVGVELNPEYCDLIVRRTAQGVLGV